MKAVVVDIDDTIVCTDRRRHAAWCRVLEREIPLQEVETKGSREILRRYAFSDRNIWNRFWMLILCVEEGGADLLKLDSPFPYASETLQKWREDCQLIYLTGRPENMRQLTLDELERFGFPVGGADLEMFTLANWRDFLSLKSSAIEARSILFSKVMKRCNVVRVVDDYPNFFVSYGKRPAIERIGLLRRKRFQRQEYLAKGATRVVRNWHQLFSSPSNI